MKTPAEIHDDSDSGVESCPYCGETTGVKAITDAPPEVPGWSCADCGTQWWITIANPHSRPWLDQLAEDVAARAVLREVIALRERADTLTEGQLRARLLELLGRLAQACHHGFPAGYRPNNKVPGVPPVPRSTAPDGIGTGTSP